MGRIYWWIYRVKGDYKKKYTNGHHRKANEKIEEIDRKF